MFSLFFKEEIKLEKPCLKIQELNFFPLLDQQKLEKLLEMLLSKDLEEFFSN